MASLPANVIVSTHPCLRVKLSQLRSASATPKETRALVHEISILLAVDALRNVLSVESAGTVSLRVEIRGCLGASDANAVGIPML